MAKDQDKTQKKAERAAKKAQRKQTRGQFVQAFNMQRKRDKMLIPIMVAAVLVPALLFFLLGLIWNIQWFLLPVGVAVGLLLAMWLFTSRLKNSMYDEIGDQPGAGAWTLEQLADRKVPGMYWAYEAAVASNQNMDAVHRLVGNPGVVLVAEGDLSRTKSMMRQTKQKMSRIAGTAPIYEFFVGEGEGQVPAKHLQREITKLPRNMDKGQAQALANRIESMDQLRRRAGLPGGPLPKNPQNMGGMNRRARRASERGKKN